MRDWLIYLSASEISFKLLKSVHCFLKRLFWINSWFRKYFLISWSKSNYVKPGALRQWFQEELGCLYCHFHGMPGHWPAPINYEYKLACAFQIFLRFGNELFLFLFSCYFFYLLSLAEIWEEADQHGQLICKLFAFLNKELRLVHALCLVV